MGSDHCAARKSSVEDRINGAVWNDGSASDFSGWLVGSGAYRGFTYYVHSRSATQGLMTEGIFPGEAPRAWSLFEHDPRWPG